MNKMLKNICLSNDISLDDPEAERKAMDVLTGNDEESAVHDEGILFLCGGCGGQIPSDTPVNVFGLIICPHCKMPNIIPNKP
tara:strand:+ start:625 stop:870 length:246 start_codon:yes stop_codon:yes gene_type:complete